MARIARFHEIGGPEKIQLVDEDPGKPGKGELLVRVRAAGLNRAEWLYLHGQYLVEPKLPSRIGVEGSGIVEAVGAGVEGWPNSIWRIERPSAARRRASALISMARKGCT